MILNLKCPVCGENLETSEDSIGKKLKCPNCDGSVLVTGDEEDEPGTFKVKVKKTNLVKTVSDISNSEQKTPADHRLVAIVDDENSDGSTPDKSENKICKYIKSLFS